MKKWRFAKSPPLDTSQWGWSRPLEVSEVDTYEKPDLPRTGNSIGGVMFSVLASNAVDRGFEPWLGKTKNYKIDIYCLSAVHALLKSKNKDYLEFTDPVYNVLGY